MSLIAIHLVDGNGQPIKTGVITWSADGVAFETRQVDNTGTVYVDTVNDAALLANGAHMLATAFGYNTAGADADAVAQYNDYTFKMPANGLSKALLVGAGIGLGALYLLSGTRKKVAGFEQLPPIAKDAIVIGGVGVALYIILFSGSKPSGAALVPAANNQLNTLAASGVHPTISAAQAESYAGQLRTAFDDCGTDWDTVQSVMQAMQNTADVWQLVSVYGTRGYKGCFDGDYFGEHNYNISEAMTSELSASEIAQINQLFASANIDFKF